MRFYRQLERGVYVMRLLPPFAVIKTLPQKVTLGAKLGARGAESSQRFSMQFGNEFLLFALGVQRAAPAVPIKLFVSVA